MVKTKILLYAAVVGLGFPVLAQLSADPWANQTPASDKAAHRTVDQNTLHRDLPQFVGENTTWNTAMGQKEIAPDANITNMLLMTQHLRNMGYQIPDGIDNLINTAPQRVRNDIMNAMIQLKSSNHPFATMSNGLAEIFERNTGLSLENLIMNSIRIVDQRR